MGSVGGRGGRGGRRGRRDAKMPRLVCGLLLVWFLSDDWDQHFSSVLPSHSASCPPTPFPQGLFLDPVSCSLTIRIHIKISDWRTYEGLSCPYSRPSNPVTGNRASNVAAQPSPAQSTQPLRPPKRRQQPRQRTRNPPPKPTPKLRNPPRGAVRRGGMYILQFGSPCGNTSRDGTCRLAC